MEISLKTKSIIFLDTNVLLRYYSISFTAREKLFNFIKKNKKRIVITNQVQYEFIKNRESTIQKFIEQVTNKIPKDFKSNIINKMKSFLELNKIILKDYLFVEKGIEKHQVELEKLLEKLNKKSTDKKKEYLDLVYNDKFLDLICECETFDALSENETLLVKNHFDILKKNIENENIDSILNKTEKVFPGLGDITKKPEDPYGDYIIYHEIMKYSKLNKKDAIFLTFDNTKGDWMSKSKKTYIHYVQNMYSNTNQILYIIDAERTLKNVLKVDVQSLVNFKTENQNDLSIKSLTNFVNNHWLFNELKKVEIYEDFIDELKLANYNYIYQIERDLLRGVSAFNKFQKEQKNKLNSTGFIRVTLRIVNPEYIYRIDVNGEKKEHSMNTSKYRKFIKY